MIYKRHQRRYSYHDFRRSPVVGLFQYSRQRVPLGRRSVQAEVLALPASARSGKWTWLSGAGLQVPAQAVQLPVTAGVVAPQQHLVGSFPS